MQHLTIRIKKSAFAIKGNKVKATTREPGPKQGSVATAHELLVIWQRQKRWAAYQSATAVVTKYHKLRDKRQLLSHSSEGYSLRSRCHQGWFLLRAGRIYSMLLPYLLVVSGRLQHSSACRSIALIEIFFFTMHYPCVFCVQISPFYKNTSHIRLGAQPTPVEPHPN